MKQTRLGEGTIHARYMKFKQKYPTNLVREKQLHECIIDKYMELAKESMKLEEEEMVELEDKLQNDPGIQEKIGKMFRMFQGIKPEGKWSSFVGFREVHIQFFAI